MSVNDCVLLIDTFIFFQTCKIAEKMKVEIDFTKRKKSLGSSYNQPWNGLNEV